jgi:phospholipid-binding lipoprotein MlaA
MIRWLLLITTLWGSFAWAQLPSSEQLVNPSAQPAPFNEKDPYEPFNRRIFQFNMAVHNSIGKPLAKGYNHLPFVVRKGTRNFLSNLGTPWTVINDVLQGKGEKALTDFMRFTINTVFGLGGLLDIATEAGIDYQPEDLGQTLYVWGVWDEASFVMLPILGPYTTREAAGSLVEVFSDPTYNALLDANGDVKLALLTLDGLDTYSRNADLIDQLKDQPDPYLFVREAYFQHRARLIYDGNPPQQDIDDIDLE